MADDDFDPEQNQPDLGQPVHPLSGWADMSNLKPEEIAQSIHDPEGFKDAMTAKNIPPPGFDVEHDGQGSFRPVSAWTASPVPPPGGEPTQQQGGVGTFKYPPDTTYSPPTGNLPSWANPQQQPSPLTAGLTPGQQASIREGATPGPPESPWPPVASGMQRQAPFRTFEGGTPVGPKPEATTPAGAQPTQGGPLDIKPTPEGIKSAEDRSKKEKEDRAKAMDDFAKMMQGIKMPQRPPPNPVGTPSVRQHSTLASPQAMALLGLLGQAGSQQPSGMPNLLARLLGRIG